MVKLDHLDPFDIYRVKPPMLAPESEKDHKSNQAYMVIAPSVKDELQWLSQTQLLKFRHLYKYFIDKRWDHLIYGAGRQVIKINTDGDITELLNQHAKGNLAKIDGVTSYLPNATPRPLRNRNVLVEANYCSSIIMNNPKDRRLITYKTNEMMADYIRIAQATGPDGYLGNYALSVIVPVNLWWTEADLKVISQKIKPVQRDVMGQLISMFSSLNMLKEFGSTTRFYFMFGEVVLVMDTQGPAGHNPTDSLFPYFKRFAMKALQAKKLEIFDMGDEDAEEFIIDQDETLTPSEKEEEKSRTNRARTKLKAAEDATKTDLVADEIMDRAYGGEDKVTPEAKTKIKAQAKAIAEKNPDSIKVVTKIKDVAPPEPGATTGEISEPVHEEISVDLNGIVLDDSEETRTIMSAKLDGKSVASQKRNAMLKEKYKDLSMGEIPLTDLLAEEEAHAIDDTPIHANVVNDNLKSLKANQFEAAYNTKLANKDLARILMHFSRVHPAMFLNKDIKIEDISTPTDRILKYTVEFEDEDRKRHHFSFKMPKMYKERYLYLANQKLNIIHQKLPYPVTKTAPNECQAVTNYKKIFTERYGGSISPRVTRLKKILAGTSCPNCIKVEKGDCTIPNSHVLTTIEYDEIGSEIIKLTMGKSTSDILRLMFIASDAGVVIDMREAPKLQDQKEYDSLIPLGLRTVNKVRTTYYISGITNKVYDNKGTDYGELSEFIITAAGWYDPKFAEEFSEISPGTRFVYSRSTVLAVKIPLILVLSSADPGGLIAVLEKAKINYTFTEKRPTVDKNTQGVVPFADGYLVFDRYPYENSLLLNGFQAIPTKEFNFLDMGTRDAYVEIFDLLYGRRNIYDGLQTFYYMFIDPITEDVLVRLGMPTDFTRLMLYCNDVLADNSYQIDSEYYNTRLRSNEIILAYLYTELADAWGRYKDGKAEKFSIPEDIIIKRCLTSNIVDPHSELNMTLEAENDRQVKLKGPSGMNEDHSFTLEKRAFHPSMAGIIGMNSTPSGEVGICRHLTLNPNIVDDRGFVMVDKGEYDGTELLTPGEMMQPFGAESADVERLAMSISQSKHVVPVADSGASLVTYDMERVMPYLSSDFAYIAKQDGKIVSIENNVMIVQYKDGSYDDVDLAERPANNTDGGFYIMNQMITEFKPGHSFKAGTILAYDPKYINRQKDMFGEPLANLGTLTRIAVESSGGVYEDSCTITDGLAHRMTTKITKKTRVILSKYANIKQIAKIGQAVQVNDPIITFDDTEDEFSSQMLEAMAEEAGDDDEVIATSAPVVTKVTGVVRDIRIYYTTPPSEMSPSLQKVVQAYIKDVQKREKTIAKYKSIQDATTITKTSQMLVPDAQGKVDGVKISDGVFIDFYIEYEDVMAAGDKQSFFCALKGIVSDIIPEEYAPYTDLNPDRKIQAYLSGIGIYKRMSLDIVKVGMLTKILIEKKRMLKEKYGERIAAAGKK